MAKLQSRGRDLNTRSCSSSCCKERDNHCNGGLSRDNINNKNNNMADFRGNISSRLTLITNFNSMDVWRRVIGIDLELTSSLSVPKGGKRKFVKSGRNYKTFCKSVYSTGKAIPDPIIYSCSEFRACPLLPLRYLSTRLSICLYLLSITTTNSTAPTEFSCNHWWKLYQVFYQSTNCFKRHRVSPSYLSFKNAWRWRWKI